jgi:archaellum component FlaC
MLLSKALKMQQDLEDKKHEAIIGNLESKIKEQSAIIEKKDFELQSTEGLLAETEAKISELNSKLIGQSEQFEQEKLELNSKLEAEVQANSNLKKSLTSLQDKCLNFSNNCIQQLKKIFYSVGASSGKFTPSDENLPKAFDHIEAEIEELDEVIAGHGDFCAWVASRGTAAAFLKAGCEHGKIVNRPNFTLSPSILDDIPDLARSISNRFIKMIWTKGGREKAGDEARSHLEPVRNHTLYLPSPSYLIFYSGYLDSCRMTKLKVIKEHAAEAEA